MVMMTSKGSEKVAVKAMKRGAVDYVIKDKFFGKALSAAMYEAVGETRLFPNN